MRSERRDDARERRDDARERRDDARERRRDYTREEPAYLWCYCVGGWPVAGGKVVCTTHFWLALREIAGLPSPRRWPEVRLREPAAGDACGCVEVPGGAERVEVPEDVADGRDRLFPGRPEVLAGRAASRRWMPLRAREVAARTRGPR